MQQQSSLQVACNMKAWERTCCDPVQRDDSAKCGVDVAGGCEHGLVQGGQQRAEDDHARGRQYVGQRPAQALAGVAEELRQGLQVADLQARRVFCCSAMTGMRSQTA